VIAAAAAGGGGGGGGGGENQGKTHNCSSVYSRRSKQSLGLDRFVLHEFDGVLCFPVCTNSGKCGDKLYFQQTAISQLPTSGSRSPSLS
jgi:hypothetical protein